jgi:Amt family ammonium transporter
MEISSGDTAWVLVSAALVMLMTPGLALFYGGLTRSKNVVGTIMQSFIMLGLISILFVLVGYSLAFGPTNGGLIGDFSYIGLKDVSATEPGPHAETVPHQAFMVFQLMFAVITPALITGAFAERAKFGPMLIFLGAWSLLVYVPMAHWVWADGGWLGELGALDFAGGNVVHINAGMAALVAAIVYGRRHNFGREPMEPHDVTMVVIGAALLWFGWFGFNAGSALAADGAAVNAFTVTQLASASAAMTWALLSWWVSGKPSVVGAASGAVAGLVAITPAAGFVGPMAAIAIGVGAGVFCYFAVRIRVRVGLDDSLDVVGVHGVGGAWGAIGVGLFAVASVGGVDGLIAGEPAQLGKQLVAIAATVAYSGAVTFVILKVIDLTLGLRVSEEAEIIGLDVSEHGERAYSFDTSTGYAGIPIAVANGESYSATPSSKPSEATS